MKNKVVGLIFLMKRWLKLFYPNSGSDDPVVAKAVVYLFVLIVRQNDANQILQSLRINR